MAFAVDLAEDAPAHFLGVHRSIGGRRWRARPAAELTVREIARRMDLPEPLARALASRGITADTAENYPRPTQGAVSRSLQLPRHGRGGAGADRCVREWPQDHRVRRLRRGRSIQRRPAGPLVAGERP